MDVIINHMTDLNLIGVGLAGSGKNGPEQAYARFSENKFHKPCEINSDSATQVHHCPLLGLKYLKTES